jgi:hypothetical protein
MATTTHSTVLALFRSRREAEAAVNELLRSGTPQSDVSMLTQADAAQTPNIAPLDEAGAGMATGTGAAVGGVAGFLAGMVALAIPGIGPLVAAGPLAAGILGGTIGAAAGGIAGMLKDHNVPEKDASRIADAVRAGRTLVAVQTSHERADKVADLLDDKGAVDVDELEEPIPTGGTATPVPPLDANAADAIRLRPEESLRERQRERARRSQVYPGITGGNWTPTV